jgi:hypothetical protein
MAARAFFLVNGDEDAAPEGQQPPSARHLAAADEILTRSKDPVAIENKAEHVTVRVAGYRYTPRTYGRRWR